MSAQDVILENITKAYGNQVVLKNLNLSVQRGELVALLGSSGCGKTTALRLIAGFLTPEKGKVLIGGQDYTYKLPNQRNTSMVFQSYALFPHMSVRENIAFGLKMHKVSSAECRTRVDEILASVRLDELQNRYPRQLSGGQQQRVGVARALVVDPKIIFADEPTGNLDSQNSSEVLALLKETARKYEQTVIMITHNPAIAHTADRVFQVSDGVLTDLGGCRA